MTSTLTAIMRIPARGLLVAMAYVTLTACVSRAAPAETAPPSRSSVAGECATTDLRVSGDLDEEPEVELPADCTPPTTLLALDLTVGAGPPAASGDDLDVSYVMITWWDGNELDSSWYGRDTTPVAVHPLGDPRWINGWNEGLVGIREGGRRLLVVPPESGFFGSGRDTLVYVLDAERVTPR